MADQQKPIRLSEARKFLHDRFSKSITGPVTELGAGGWSRAFAFELDGREMVARFGEHRGDYELDQAAMQYAGPDLPVPTMIEIGDAFDGAYAISERHRGVFLESLDAQEWRRFLPALFRALDTLRHYPATWPADWITDYPALVNGVGGLWGGQLLSSLADDPAARVSGWREMIARSSKLQSVFVAAERQFTDLLPICPTEPHLIHGDLLNRNVLVSEDAKRLSAVFDWGCLKYGDFLYELAWFTFLAPWFPGLARIDIRSAGYDHYRSAGDALENFDERMRCYELHIGLDHLAFYVFRGDHRQVVAVAGRLQEVLDGR